MAKWAAGLGFVGVQVPSWDGRLFDLEKASESKAYCDDVKGRLAERNIELTELSTHLHDDTSGMAIYRSKLHATLKRNYQLMPALRWLRLLMNHIPNKYEHLVRCYGYYSNRSRRPKPFRAPAPISVPPTSPTR